MDAFKSRVLAIVTLDAEYNEYNSLVRWEIVDYGDHITEETPLLASQTLLDITGGMPMRPAADNIVDVGELRSSGYYVAEAAGASGDDTPVAEYAKAHNFTCILEWMARYENVNMKALFPGMNFYQYSAVYTFKETA